VKEPPDLHELIGDDVPQEELESLRRADAALRAVPAPPPELPSSLTQSVARVPPERTTWTRRRLVTALAFAAAVAALAFALGRWTGGDSFDERLALAMEPTRFAPEQSWGRIQVGERDEATGNWQLRLTVDGLRRLPPGESYYLWLERDGEWAGTCGSFAVGEGETTVDMTVSYRLRDFDAWVISRFNPDGEPPRLLEARIDRTPA
jgi:Anti-sigma-K factor rskA